ncbi:MAG: TIGR03013 family PEP-CTERM/XrtA system glycosyltransferase [Planctomycetota bacterium]
MVTLAQQIIPKRKLLLIASETLLLSTVLFLGTTLPPLGDYDLHAADQASILRLLLSCLTIAVLCQASLSYSDLYDWNLSQNRSELPNRLLHSCGYALVMLSALVFVSPALFHFPGLRNQTWPLIVLVLVGFVGVYAWRLGFHFFFYKWNFGERVAVLGSGDVAAETVRLIQSHPVSGFEVVGVVLSDPKDATGYTAPILGNQSNIRDLVDGHRIARIVAALPDRRGKLPVNELLLCRLVGVKIEERETMYERIHGKIALEGLRPSYLIFGAGFSQPPAAVAIKRTLDIVASLTGLALSAPISLLAVLLIKVDSRGPVFFRQPRVGQDGVHFNVLKFRTMRTDAEKHTGPVWAKANDDRITRVGRVLRLTRIDEIPQMLNVLAGHMSFVGPRPERPFFVEELTKQIDFYPLRLTVKPGITGWAQVRHPYGASVDDAKEKLRYDLYYIKNMSPLFDLNILLRTVGVILFGKGAR